MSATLVFHRLTLLHVLAGILAVGVATADAQTPNYRRWLLAEGAANDFFDEEILIGNPNTTAANVTITLLPEVFPGEATPPEPVVIVRTVPAVGRYTFKVNSLPVEQLRRGAVSAIVECTNDLDIVVERSMTWPFGQRRGAHNSQGVLAPAATWYLAEGVTGFFQTFILIANTSTTTAANVEVEFLQESGAPVQASYVIPANGRKTVYVNQDFGPAQPVSQQVRTPFSTVVRQTNGADIVAERAMYWNDFEGGHGATGVTAPSETWLFAEGTTGGGATFDWQTYLLLANPNASSADVTITFFRDSGGPVTYSLSGTDALRADSRKTLFLDELIFANGIKELASTSFAIRVESSQPILAERAMYWSSNGIVFVEGHNTPGVTAEASKWAFAEGREGRFSESGLLSHDTYFLFSNSTASPIRVKGTFLREDGTGVVHTFTIAAASRLTLPTGSLPGLSNQRFASFFEAVDENGQPVSQTFVVERAQYWGDGYFGGHAATGTPWTGTIGTPAAIPAPAIGSIAPTNGPLAGGTDVAIQGSNFSESSVVRFGSAAATEVMVLSATTIIATTPAGAAPGAVQVCVDTPSSPSACTANAFTYDPPPPTEPYITVDNILGFGDSITAGRSRMLCDSGLCENGQTPWPERVRQRLQAFYPRQTVVTQTSGVAGECASASGCSGQSGRSRLAATLAPSHELVVILEGINDINAGIGLGTIIDAIRDMIRNARAQGKDVLIAKLTPFRNHELSDMPPVDFQRWSDFNRRIDDLAAAEGVGRVDFAAALGEDVTRYISPDGLHPTNDGYERMARAVVDKIIERFEVRP